MTVRVDLITTLQNESGLDTAVLELPCHDVPSCLKVIKQYHPSLHRCICDERGTIRPHIALFVNDTLLPRSDYGLTSLSDDDRLSIMTAVSGG